MAGIRFHFQYLFLFFMPLCFFHCAKARSFSAGPENIHLAALSDTSVTVSWAAPDEESSYFIALTTDSSATSCPTNSYAVSSSAASFTFTGLTASTDYTFILCSIRSDGVASSVSKTAQVRTLRADCEYTVHPGDLDAGKVGALTFAHLADGIDSFDEFESFLGQHPNFGNSTSKIVCIADDVEIKNLSSLASGSKDRITVSSSGFTISGGTTAVFHNYVTSGGSGNQDGLFANGHALSLEYLTVIADGGSGSAIFGNGSSTLTISHVTVNAKNYAINSASSLTVTYSSASVTGPGNTAALQLSGSGSHLISADHSTFTSTGSTGGAAILANQATIDAITHCTVSLSGTLSYAVSLVNSTVTAFTHNTVTVDGGSVGVLISASTLTNYSNNVVETGTADSNSGLTVSASSIAALEDSQFIFHGSTVNGIYLGASGSIASMDEVQLILDTASTTTASHAFVSDNSSVANNYFTSAAITNVTVCSAVSSIARWEDTTGCAVANTLCGLLADSSDGILMAAPTTYQAHGAVFGAKTFPHAVPLAVGTQSGFTGITLGGVCP